VGGVGWVGGAGVCRPRVDSILFIFAPY